MCTCIGVMTADRVITRELADSYGDTKMTCSLCNNELNLALDPLVCSRCEYTCLCRGCAHKINVRVPHPSTIKQLKRHRAQPKVKLHPNENKTAAPTRRKRTAFSYFFADAKVRPPPAIGVPGKEVMRVMAELWQTLTAEQKRPYEDMVKPNPKPKPTPPPPPPPAPPRPAKTIPGSKTPKTPKRCRAINESTGERCESKAQPDSQFCGRHKNQATKEPAKKKRKRTLQHIRFNLITFRWCLDSRRRLRRSGRWRRCWCRRLRWLVGIGIRFGVRIRIRVAGLRINPLSIQSIHASKIRCSVSAVFHSVLLCSTPPTGRSTKT